MANFTFPKRSAEDERLPEEEGTDLEGSEERGRQTGGVRGVVIIVGIVVAVLIGGWYLARPLFFASPLSRPAGPVRPVTPAPQANAPVPIPPAKETVPSAPAQPPNKEEAKAAPSVPPGKVAVATPSPEKLLTPEKKAEAPAKAVEKPGSKAVPTSFSLQMGAMVMEENAVALKRKLDGSGFPAVVRKGTAYVTKQVVTVGEPTGKREAEELSRRLNVDGFPSQLRNVGDKYTPQLGEFFDLDEAIDLARELQTKKYAPKITSKPSTTVVYQVRHGRFDSRASAVRRGEELKGKGFSFLVVRE